MKYLVRLTERAARDLESIYDFIEADSSENAFRWFNELAESINSLESYPERGAPVSRSKTTRQILFGENPHTYKTIYAVERKRKVVNVLHLRHGARRPIKLDTNL